MHQIHQQYVSVRTEPDTTTESEQKNVASLRTMIDNLRTAMEQKEQEVVSRNQQYDVIERKVTEYQKESEHKQLQLEVHESHGRKAAQKGG